MQDNREKALPSFSFGNYRSACEKGTCSKGSWRRSNPVGDAAN